MVKSAVVGQSIKKMVELYKMNIKFEYTRELPIQRLGDGLVDIEKPSEEKVSGEVNIEDFLNQISNEGIIRNIKIFNTDGKEYAKKN